VRRAYALSLAGGTALALSAFLPWLRLGDVGLAGIPDPAGFFVLGLGLLGIVLSVVGLRGRRETRQMLVLVGIAALTTLVVVWRTGPATITERAQVRAEAVALVDNVPAVPVPPAAVGIGLLMGLVSATAITVVGLTGVWTDRGVGG
jgi:hypothetical protein